MVKYRSAPPRRVTERGRNCFEIAPSTGAGLLVDGHDYFGALFRALGRAEQYVLISGWQFDSGARLLRGAEAEGEGDVEFLPYLRGLCERRPGLRVFILAWDFSVLYAPEREWFQGLLFNWNSHPRLTFRVDSNTPLWGAHHHKTVIVDGALAFVGGMDVCADRWDERDHRKAHPERVDPSGESYGPYHDLQAVMQGPVVGAIEAYFKERWRQSGAGELLLPPAATSHAPIDATFALGAWDVALSRTLGATVMPLQEPVREVRQLFLDSIDAAERIVYVENQYLSSVAVHDAFVRRMRAAGRSKLEIVIVMPARADGAMERLAIGHTQARVLYSLAHVAAETGHALGVYCTGPEGAAGDGCATYIHAKLMIVDDRLLTLGSANATNRSMGLDSELNVTWEACSPQETALARAIRRARIGLLAEHTGAVGFRMLLALARPGGLVARLDAMAGQPGCRLFPHDNGEALQDEGALQSLAATTADPTGALIEEDVVESLQLPWRGLLARGASAIRELLAPPGARTAGGG
jgi:phospholipase D1/2